MRVEDLRLTPGEYSGRLQTPLRRCFRKLVQDCTLSQLRRSRLGAGRCRFCWRANARRKVAGGQQFGGRNPRSWGEPVTQLSERSAIAIGFGNLQQVLALPE